MSVNPKEKAPEPEWTECHSFEEWVVAMLKAKKGKTPEFQAVVTFHGREKIERIWDEYKRGKK